MTKATFNDAAEETIKKALAVCAQRGGEYNDSWAIENIKTPFLDNTLQGFGIALTASAKRLIVLAALADVKISRLVGPYKEDSAVDLINYVAAYNSLRLRYDIMETIPEGCCVADTVYEPAQSGSGFTIGGILVNPPQYNK
jgi:hypothetical protein